MKWFAFQRGPCGPEPVTFYDEAPVSSAHTRRILSGTLREIPEEHESLSLAELVKLKKE